MAEGYPDKGKVFKLTDSTGSKKTIVKYQYNYKEFSLKCKHKFGIPESETIILETEDGFEIDEESIPDFDNFSILVLRQQKASVCNESTDEIGIASDERSNPIVEDTTTESTDEIGIASDVRSNPSVEDTTAESTYAIGIASDERNERSSPIIEDTTAESTDEIGTLSDECSNLAVEDTTTESTESDVIGKASDKWSDPAVEDTTAGAKEIKRKLKEHGDENVEEIVRSSVDEWKFSPLNICVTGSSGNGKSYLINVLRDVYDPKDKSYAKSGTTETTDKCTDYPHPKYKNIIYWDVPGVGTLKFPKETYLSDINVDRYDFFLICSCARFKEDDSWLADEIEKRHKRFYFLRTKVDQDLDSAFHDQGTDFNSQQVLATIRNDCEMNLPDKSCFLVSSYHPTLYDFPLLLKRLVEDAPSEQKHALLLGLCVSSAEAIERKAKFLEGEIWKTAFLSSLGDAVPGASAALICRTAESYMEAFKLTDEEINTFAVHIRVTADSLRKDAGLMLGPDKLTKDCIAGLIGKEPAVKKSAIVVPVIGYSVAGTSSYLVTGRILRKLLNDCKNDALKVFDFVAARLGSK